MNPVYTRQQLESYKRPQLWDICRTNGLKCHPASANCVEAILTHQSAQVEKVAVAEVKLDEQAVAQAELETHLAEQAETIAPEITTVEISFYDHEVYAHGKQIASITSPFKVVKFGTKIGHFNIQKAQNLSGGFKMVALKQRIFVGHLERAGPV